MKAREIPKISYLDQYKNFLKNYNKFMQGRTPDIDEDEYEEFSVYPCPCCRTKLAGSRHKLILDGEEYWVCPDCKHYTRFGELDDFMLDNFENEAYGFGVDNINVEELIENAPHFDTKRLWDEYETGKKDGGWK